jgi:hypothetical protein
MSYTQAVYIDYITMYSIYTHRATPIHESCMSNTSARMPYTSIVYMTYTVVNIDYITDVFDIHDRFFKQKRCFAFLLFSGKGIFKIEAILHEQKTGF